MVSYFRILPLTNEVVMLKIVQSDEEINSNGGLALVKGLLDANPAMRQWDTLLPAAAQARFGTTDIVRCMVGLMTTGVTDFAGVARGRADALLARLCGGAMPSEATFRQRLDSLAAKAWAPVLDSCVASQLRPSAMGRVSVGGLSLIPLDIDVSVLEDRHSRKEGVAWTYMNVPGYAPILCYAGTEGHMVANELRPGNRHCGCGAAGFVRRCVEVMRKAGAAPEELLVRVDSGHDSGEFIAELIRLNVRFLVKRNPRRESPGQLLDSVRGMDPPVRPRPGKAIHRGVRADRSPAGCEGHRVFMVIEGVERTVTRSGQRLLLPEVEVSSWWTNLPLKAAECVGLYHAHGTSEQFHSELKSDMGVEQLPSGHRATNALILGLSTIAFNCMRDIGQRALTLAEEARKAEEAGKGKEDREEGKAEEARKAEEEGKDREPPGRLRLRTVLLDYIKVGCKLVRHAGQELLKFGRGCYNFMIFKGIYDSL